MREGNRGRVIRGNHLGDLGIGGGPLYACDGLPRFCVDDLERQLELPDGFGNGALGEFSWKFNIVKGAVEVLPHTRIVPRQLRGALGRIGVGRVTAGQPIRGLKTTQHRVVGAARALHGRQEEELDIAVGGANRGVDRTAGSRFVFLHAGTHHMAHDTGHAEFFQARLDHGVEVGVGTERGRRIIAAEAVLLESGDCGGEFGLVLGGSGGGHGAHSLGRHGVARGRLNLDVAAGKRGVERERGTGGARDRGELVRGARGRQPAVRHAGRRLLLAGPAALLKGGGAQGGPDLDLAGKPHAHQIGLAVRHLSARGGHPHHAAAGVDHARGEALADQALGHGEGALRGTLDGHVALGLPGGVTGGVVDLLLAHVPLEGHALVVAVGKVVLVTPFEIFIGGVDAQLLAHADLAEIRPVLVMDVDVIRVEARAGGAVVCARGRCGAIRRRIVSWSSRRIIAGESGWLGCRRGRLLALRGIPRRCGGLFVALPRS